jgi:acyl-CoA thioesterase-1
MFVRTLAIVAWWALLAAAMPASAQRASPVILLVGDSVSAGYGLPTGVGWATLLQQRLDAQHLRYRVVNASISGDTTAGGRARLGALLAQHHPAITIIELGGNDGLRGGSIASTRDNLAAMTSARCATISTQ